jgi:hypothetical protein
MQRREGAPYLHLALEAESLLVLKLLVLAQHELEIPFVFAQERLH